MVTLRLKVRSGDLASPAAREALDRAAAILRAGGLVALPTETVYGLGANALDATSVARIFAAKQRPAWDPVIVHIAPAEPANARSGTVTQNMLVEVTAEIPEAARRLIDAFWPGPLTLLLPRSGRIPDAVTAGRPLVGVRMPAHPVALEVIRRAGVPVAAPSANLFSHVSPTTAEHVLQDLDGRIDAVVDAGPARHGLESTVLDPCRGPMVIYRPGAVTAEQIRKIAGPVEYFQETAPPTLEPDAPLPAPGVGLRHYAPRARLITIDAAPSELKPRLDEAARRFERECIGLLLPAGVAAPASVLPEHVRVWGRWEDPEEMARALYAALRALDEQGCTVILCPLPREDGIGAAIRDRLRKAAR